jgi:hypothetical protein
MKLRKILDYLKCWWNGHRTFICTTPFGRNVLAHHLCGCTTSSMVWFYKMSCDCGSLQYDAPAPPSEQKCQHKSSPVKG